MTDGDRVASCRVPVDAQQDLLLQPATQAIDQLVDRLGLVAGRLEGRLEPEIGHPRLYNERQVSGDKEAGGSRRTRPH